MVKLFELTGSPLRKLPVLSFSAVGWNYHQPTAEKWRSGGFAAYYIKLSASRYALIRASSPSLPGAALPCSIPNTPLYPLL